MLNRYNHHYDITPMPTHVTRKWSQDQHLCHLKYWPNYLKPREQWRTDAITTKGLTTVNEMEALHNQWRDFARRNPGLEDNCGAILE